MENTQTTFRETIRDWLIEQGAGNPDIWMCSRLNCSWGTLFNIYRDIEAGNFDTPRLKYIVKLKEAFDHMRKGKKNPIPGLLKDAGWEG